MAITIEMPRLSDSMHEGIVLRWVKKIGDFVEVGDHLADIETDKAHVELQACEDGTLMEILVPEGGSAAVGAPIALLQSEFGAASCDCPPCPPVKCSPLAARLAAEAGLRVEMLPLRTTAEDFGFYCTKYPSLFYRLGVGAAAGRPHTATFNPDEGAIDTGIDYMKRLALQILKK